MYTRLLMILLPLFLFPTALFSQKCPPFYERGSMYNTTENTQTGICYKRGTIVDSDPDVYHTNYTIANGEGKELYDIHLYFNKRLDSISVVYFNIPSGITSTKPVTFGSHSSIRMFKDYEANDTTISLNSRNCTLFTIPEPTRPYIILNQFRLLDDDNTYLSLNPVSADKLQQHLSEVEGYKNWRDSMHILSEAEQQKLALHKKGIADILKEMEEYKEAEIKKIQEADEDSKTMGVYAEANTEMQALFLSKLDPVFNNYYSKVFPFENKYSEMSFTFFCDADGNIQPLKTDIHSVNSEKLQWFEDSFKVNLERIINTQKYKTMVTTNYHPSILTDFDARFIKPFNDLDPSNEEFAQFASAKTAIYNVLEKYLARDKSSPTKYSYVIKYKSTVEDADWQYEINRKGIEKIGPKSLEESIPQDLKNIFKNKIVKPGTSKYHIKICKIYLNGLLVGEDIKTG